MHFLSGNPNLNNHLPLESWDLGGRFKPYICGISSPRHSGPLLPCILAKWAPPLLRSGNDFRSQIVASHPGCQINGWFTYSHQAWKVQGNWSSNQNLHEDLCSSRQALQGCKKWILLLFSTRKTTNELISKMGPPWLKGDTFSKISCLVSMFARFWGCIYFVSASCCWWIEMEGGKPHGFQSFQVIRWVLLLQNLRFSFWSHVCLKQMKKNSVSLQVLLLWCCSGDVSQTLWDFLIDACTNSFYQWRYLQNDRNETLNRFTHNRKPHQCVESLRNLSFHSKSCIHHP